ncbi:hypothetical protein [Cupriavidus necator]
MSQAKSAFKMTVAWRTLPGDSGPAKGRQAMAGPGHSTDVSDGDQAGASSGLEDTLSASHPRGKHMCLQ